MYSVMKPITRICAALLVSGAISVTAKAAEHTLTISAWAPPTHGLNSIMWPNFIKMVEEATDGKVSAEIKYGLAPPPAQMDLVMDGAADLSVIFHGYQPGRFTATKLIELPGYEGSPEAASVAYWRVHQEHLEKLNEHRGVKLIALHTHGPAQLHSHQPVTELAQIAGMKIRIPGGVGGDVGKALGATGIQVPAPKVYETLASKAADGVVMPFESRKGFKLTEVAQNVYEIPGGLYRGSFAYIMNEDTFADLPEDIQKALEEKVFGEGLSRMLGAAWTTMDQEGLEVTTSASDNAINSATEADLASYAKIATDVVNSVLKQLEDKGVDAEAAYQMVKDEMAAN